MKHAPRYISKEKAVLLVFGKASSIIVKIKNLSESGACLEWDASATNVQKGDLVKMTVVLNVLKKKHDLVGEVIWTRGNILGVKFIPPEDLLLKMFQREDV